MTSFPTPPRYRQRWVSFRNSDQETIPPFAIVGPQIGEPPNDDAYDAIEGAQLREPVLRLGRPRAAFVGGQDAALFYVNGPQAVLPGSFGNCTQDGPMQALVSYPSDSPPSWNAYLAIDLFDIYNRDASFGLVPGSGGYRLISFHGCPETTFRDPNRPNYEHKVAWIAPAYQDHVPAGLVFRMGSGAEVVGPKSIVPFGTSLGPQCEWFGAADRITYSDSQAQTDRLAGFFRIPTQGHYLLNFSATIRSPDAPIAGAYTLGLIARTGRYGEALDKTLDRPQIEAALDVLQEGSTYPNFNGRHQLLTATLGVQPADTNLYHDEVDGYITARTPQEVARHWFTISGSTVLDIFAGDTFFFFNPTSYQIQIENFSGTLTLLPGTPSFTTRNNVRGRA
ncbi:hypothetical protein DTL42_18255 [Bremerella cremea]|uniref:Uncharacterized protein n=1 Tax=Bremerella cremea TaxID=1031537 RepID=A0A368KMM5_9BACT|nr:hypothetical protein [Bremerella cremea]RCS43929.1 hypothetical protein DTL42_18255 [Bremerella cremea]